MGLTLVTAPTAYPVTLAEAKLHCRIDGTDEDAAINGFIAAATDYVEQYTGRSIMAQTWKLSQDAFEDSFRLPKGPVQSVSAITYYDASDALQTLPASNYTLDKESDPAWIVRNSETTWPETATGVNVVQVTYVAGYLTVPASIKHAILLLVGDWYANRENTGSGMVEAPHAVTALLANYRAYLF